MNAHSKVERNSKLNIAQRINAAMLEVDYVQKEKKQGMNYSIVSHDAVTAKVRPILQAHGVVYYPRNMVVQQNGNRTEAMFDVRFENVDDRTDHIDVATFGYGVDPQDKGPGKAMSYGVKYALLKVLGLETGDDPDVVQDNRADHAPANPKTGETPPSKSVPLNGPYNTKAKLWAAVRSFDRTVRGMGDLSDLNGFLQEDETKALLRQCQDEAKGLWSDGLEELPEYVPLKTVIAECRSDLMSRQPNILNAG